MRSSGCPGGPSVADPDGLPQSALIAGVALFASGRLSPGALCVLAVLDQVAPRNGETFRLGHRPLAIRARVNKHSVAGYTSELEKALGRSRFSCGRSQRKESTYWLRRPSFGAPEAPDVFGRNGVGLQEPQMGRHLGLQEPQSGALGAPPDPHGSEIPSPAGGGANTAPPPDPPGGGAGPPTGLRPEPPAPAPAAPTGAGGGPGDPGTAARASRGQPDGAAAGGPGRRGPRPARLEPVPVSAVVADLEARLRKMREGDASGGG